MRSPGSSCRLGCITQRGADMTVATLDQTPTRLSDDMLNRFHERATALAVNMHIYWTGVAADLRKLGDPSLEWMLRESAAGEVFAAGHAESGNDLPVLLSTSKAERVDGGYRFYGRKHFGSLT